MDDTMRPSAAAWFAVAPILAAALTFRESAAVACGAAYPGGPVVCDYAPARSEAQRARPIARVSASYAYTSTVLLFGDGRRADLTRSTVFGGVELPLSRRTSLTMGAGGVAGGALAHGAAHDALGPGFAGAVGVAWRAYTPSAGAPWPFVQLSATISGTHLLTRSNGLRTDGSFVPPEATTQSYDAFDLRVAAIAGYHVGASVTPYALARAFGGPAYWHYDGAAVTGTDLHKYQLGAGLSLALLDARLDVFVEGVPLGESGFTAGVGSTFF
jgi:hypothetical protein